MLATAPSALPLVVAADAVAPVPWRNGGGRTRVLLEWPAGDWWLRISVADVAASGPFSVFPGVERRFAVLEGGPLRLATAGRAPVEISVGDAELHAFDGEAATDCTLLGAATRDLNVMARRDAGRLACVPLRDARARAAGRASGRAAERAGPGVRTDRGPYGGDAATALGLFVVGAHVLRIAGHAPLALPPCSLAWWSAAPDAALAVDGGAPDARGWWLEWR